MLKLTKTGIGLLTKQYRSVLKKCLLLNLGLFIISSTPIVVKNADAAIELYYLNAVNTGVDGKYNFTVTNYMTGSHYATLVNYGGVSDMINSALSSYLTTSQVNSAISQAVSGFVTNDVQSLNYYYTFRGDESEEVIEFTGELRSNEKEMSSLDFIPIKSSSDLRINLIKAEDPLTFSAKTRDDYLVLMEVCHA